MLLVEKNETFEYTSMGLGHSPEPEQGDTGEREDTNDNSDYDVL